MRSKINYQLETDRILAQLPAERTPTLFLHACCAPCSSYVLEYLSRYFAITLFFYNPNISPEAEYLHRKAELCRLVQELPLGNPVTVVDGDYLPERFYALAKGLEQEPERGARCQKCIGHRLEEAFRAAAALEISPDFVCTTLTISPHKDAVFINTRGAEGRLRILHAELSAELLRLCLQSAGGGTAGKTGGILRGLKACGIAGLHCENFCKKQLTSFGDCAILVLRALKGTAHFAEAFCREPLSPAESSGKK